MSSSTAHTCSGYCNCCCSGRRIIIGRHDGQGICFGHRKRRCGRHCQDSTSGIQREIRRTCWKHIIADTIIMFYNANDIIQMPTVWMKIDRSPLIQSQHHICSVQKCLLECKGRKLKKVSIILSSFSGKNLLGIVEENYKYNLNEMTDRYRRGSRSPFD